MNYILFFSPMLIIVAIMLTLWYISDIKKSYIESVEKAEEKGIVDSKTRYTYNHIKILKDADNFKCLGNGWLTFQWRNKYYLSYFDHGSGGFSSSIMIEITKEQYEKE